MPTLVFETVNTNRRIMVNFDQVCKVTAGGATCVIHYSDGNTDVVRATFDQIASSLNVAPDTKVGA